MMTQHHIHISDVLAFKQCRRAWNWSSLLRSNLTPKRIYVPFFVGTAIHAALEGYYANNIPLLDSFNAWYQTELIKLAKSPNWSTDQELVDEQVTLIRDILAHYEQWVKRDRSLFSDMNLEFIALEKAFTVPMRMVRGRKIPGVVLSGRFDGIVRHKLDGKLYLYEVKTTRSITQRIQQLDTEEQANAYMIAASQMLKEPLAGVIYTLIRKKAPETPKTLKDGTLSVNKALDTTAEDYLLAIRQFHNGMISDEAVRDKYGEMLQHLLNTPNKFFQRVVVYRTPQELQNAQRDLNLVAREMVSSTVAIYPHGGAHCNYCLYREPCLAMNSGDMWRVAQMLELGYEQNTYHEKRTGDE